MNMHMYIVTMTSGHLYHVIANDWNDAAWQAVQTAAQQGFADTVATISNLGA